MLSEYFERVRQAISTSQLSTHVGSFFPYSASVLDPWTGFYATRPLLKKRIREAEAALRTAELLQATALLNGLNSTHHEKQIVSARVRVYLMKGSIFLPVRTPTLTVYLLSAIL